MAFGDLTDTLALTAVALDCDESGGSEAFPYILRCDMRLPSII